MMMIAFLLLCIGGIVAVGIALFVITAIIAQNNLLTKRKRGESIPDKIKRGTSYVILDDGEDNGSCN